MKTSEIKKLRKDGMRPVDILHILVREKGYEFPDATAAIQYALNLSTKAFDQMREEY